MCEIADCQYHDNIHGQRLRHALIKMIQTAADRKVLLTLALVFVVALVAHILPSPRTIDDAFITFRYSRNIAAGEGFVYNPGVRVMGTTTPLYTLLMAAVSIVTGGQDFPWYALTVGALASAGTAIFLCLLMRRVTGSLWLGALIGILWGISPVSVTFSVGGMETPLNIFWLVGATYWFISRRSLWMGVFIGLGFLTRIDAALWIGPLMLFQLGEYWQAHRGTALRIPWRTWLPALLIVTPWVLFAWAYFGSPIPNSIAAKSVVYKIDAGASFVTLFRAYIVPFSDYQLLGSTGVMLATIFYVLFALSGLIWIARNFPRLLPFVLYPWLYMLIFSLANPLIFRWYTAPPIPALMFTIIIGAWRITEAIRQSAPQRARLAPVLMGGLGLLWVSASLAGWELVPDHGPQRPAPELAWHQLELHYREMADELITRYHVTPDTPVAASDIGVIGYFTGSRIIDTVGLVTPEARAYYPIDYSLVVSDQNYAIPPQLIYDMRPAYLVTTEGAVRLGLEQDETFKSSFALVREIPADFYGKGVVLYRAQPAS